VEGNGGKVREENEEEKENVLFYYIWKKNTIYIRLC